MIEDKEHGIKIAENKLEKAWISLKERLEQEIEMSEHTIAINKEILKVCDKNIKK